MKTINLNFYIFYIILFGFVYFGLSEGKNISEIITLKHELKCINKQSEIISIKINKDSIDVGFNNSNKNSKFAKLLSEFEYIDFVINLSKQYNQDPRIFLSMIYVESGFNADALSPKEASGLMQLTKSVLGKDADPYNEVQNIFIGISYFNYLYNDIYKDYDSNNRLLLSIAAYNCGMNNIVKAQANVIKLRRNSYANIEKYLPTETKNYVASVLYYKNIINLN
jgi:soluble lytic murein transglycosylase-like protein